VGDVLNYIKPTTIKEFFQNIENALESGGVFICDLNTLHGFEDVTAGSMVIDKDDEFMSIDAEFFADVLRSEIVYFHRDGECFKKQKEAIFQYYHSEEDLENATSLKLIESEDICMFSDESDKRLFVFVKE
jgi:hypothetical protein